ncbi:sec-independent protein translocase protein TatB [Quadrisphaera granulorum]|uniref:Sec-independent protein translocase protein TatB n=1 Tax=Quadrisphaera granulorum TaxID=317664 RepID=A0A316AGX2_9ACTN|nr:sec-independent protein translocase protein TatB [Quadrisphaera granulorum]SZE94824.1 sec-independent protein translocase protein TatB [Quadrisphaera granulorum]
MFGINPGEFAVLLLVVLIVVGPERLPQYAQQLGRMVREGRKMAMGLREQVRGELGPEFDDVDWKKLDPRQYDPRKIIADALSAPLEDDDEPAAPATKPVSSGGPAAVSGAAAAGAGAAGVAAGATAAGAVAAAASPGDEASASPSNAGHPSVSPADKRPAGSDEASPAVVDPASDGADAPAVPMARSAAGAPVDLEAT